MRYRTVKTLLEFGLGLVGYPSLRVVPLNTWVKTGKVCSKPAHIIDQGALCSECSMIHFRPEEIEEFDKEKLYRMTLKIQAFMVQESRPRTPVDMVEHE